MSQLETAQHRRERLLRMFIIEDNGDWRYAFPTGEVVCFTKQPTPEQLDEVFGDIYSAKPGYEPRYV